MMRSILLASVALLCGCSFVQPTNELRVVELSGSYLTASGVGCRVVGEKQIKGCVKIKTEHCSVETADCPASTP